ncbi:MAG: UvrD-helicase domain-containing protein [Elusimicrobia bacterium]|nr:UvrD-helicase domain-containing protein [Elusimicrobiota bacterium]
MEPRSPAAASDQDERDRARLRLDACVVVEAGAGTGKTTLLADRILFRVLAWDRPRPARIEEVVALTFTEKAAGEIRLRLSDRLAELAARLAGAPLSEAAAGRADLLLGELRGPFGKGDAELLARARAALEDLDKAPIGTIHSFCAQLLRLHPVEAGMDPGFRVDEGDAFDELFAAEWAAWLDDELGERPPRRSAWLELLALAKLDEIEALARALCSERLDPAELGRPDPEAAAALRALGRAAAALPEGRPQPHGSSRIVPVLGACRARLEAAADAAAAEDPALDASEPPVPGKSAWPKAWGEDAAGTALHERALAAAAAASPRGEAAARRAARLLRPFAERFRREYARRGWISFDGLLRRARDLMRDHPAARADLQARCAAILVDEFQDTDPLQGELLLFLSERPGAGARDWRKLEPEPGRLFVVGDPKQSIYRFRGADIAAYEGFTARLRERGALSCGLSANFRSVPGVVEAVNAAFASAMRPEPEVQPAYRPIRAARPAASGPAVELVAVENSEASAAEVQRTEAAWLARWILDHGRVPGAPPDGRRPLKEMALLLRSSSALRPFLDAFKRAGIPYAVEIERFFYEAPEIADFLNLLRVLDEPGDRAALAGLLRSPAALLTDDALLSLARADAFDYRRSLPPRLLAAAERGRAEALYAALRDLRARVGREPLGDLVGAALERTNLVELAARAYHGQQTVSNLLKLGRLAAEASDGRGTSLAEFAARVRQAAADQRREGESPLADESLEAVRVLSIHKAKGLEFPVVFAANLSGRPGGASDKPAVRFAGLGGRPALRLGGRASAAAALADVLERGKERAEAVRLLYVAMTRAREKLFLLGGAEPAAHSLASHLEEAGFWPLSGPGIAATRVAPGGVPEPETSAAPAAVPSKAETTALLTAWERRKARRERATVPRTRAATGYLKEAPKAAPVPEEEPASPAGAEVGQLCHRVLQDWDFKQGGDVASTASRVRAALERRAPGPRWAEAEIEAARVLAGFLASPAAKELAAAEILGREVPFAYADGPTVVRGAMDLIARVAGRLVVVDFKSGRVEEASAASARERYAEQGRLYAEAVRRAWGETPEFRLLFLRRPEL